MFGVLLLCFFWRPCLVKQRKFCACEENNSREVKISNDPLIKVAYNIRIHLLRGLNFTSKFRPNDIPWKMKEEASSMRFLRRIIHVITLLLSTVDV